VSAVSAGRLRQSAAWGVHLFTASGAAAGVLGILAIERGDAAAAFGWMAYALAVDAVDGTFARTVGVKQVLPTFDGTKLDDIVDYVTYVILPAFFLLHFDVLPATVAVPVVLCPVLASAYGFCRTDAKTPDHFFTGFPSYWNVVAFYLYVLDWPPALNAAVVVAFSVAVFVPVRYVYPSRTPTWRAATVGLGIVWGMTMLYLLFCLARQASTPRHLVLVSLAYPVYYCALSLALTVRRSTPAVTSSAAHPR